MCWNLTYPNIINVEESGRRAAGPLHGDKPPHTHTHNTRSALPHLQRREQGCPAEGDAELLSPLNMAAIRRDVGEGISAKASADTITRLGLRLGALAAAIK